MSFLVKGVQHLNRYSLKFIANLLYFQSQCVFPSCFIGFCYDKTRNKWLIVKPSDRKKEETNKNRKNEKDMPINAHSKGKKLTEIYSRYRMKRLTACFAIYSNLDFLLSCEWNSNACFPMASHWNHAWTRLVSLYWTPVLKQTDKSKMFHTKVEISIEFMQWPSALIMLIFQL